MSYNPKKLVFVLYDFYKRLPLDLAKQIPGCGTMTPPLLAYKEGGGGIKVKNSITNVFDMAEPCRTKENLTLEIQIRGGLFSIGILTNTADTSL
jgi:hypothetical protein